MLMKVDELIVRDPEILSGMPVFVGTRVPARTLLDYLAAGDTLEQFLDDFPSVSREKATALLDMLAETFEEKPTESAA